MRVRLFAGLFLFASLLDAAGRVLYVTHSAGFRHDSIETSIRALEDIARRSGRLEIVATEDLSRISADSLREFDAVFFFTSGELALSERQKQDLLDFVRQGKGFGGAHSATDTLYTWAAYGDMIGAYFDGHPWAQEASIDIEDPGFPGQSELGSSFRITEELYQFRAFSRDRVRVLYTLDTAAVDLTAPGVNRTDGDFALAWCRNYGLGRVYYTALGHFDDTWLDPRFQKTLEQALLWLTGQIEADAAPRTASTALPPSFAASNIATPAGPPPVEATLAPGSIVAIYGEHLTSGSEMSADRTPLPRKLAGTSVEFGGRTLPLYYVSPGQVNAQLPFDVAPRTDEELTVRSALSRSAPVAVRIASTSPALVAGVRLGGALVVFGSGWGEVEGTAPAAGVATPREPLQSVTATPVVRINGLAARVLFAGLTPTLVSVYQMNLLIPDGASPPFTVEAEIRGVPANRLEVE